MINCCCIDPFCLVISDRNSGVKFCQYTGFPETSLYVDPTAELHRQLDLYQGLTLKFPGLSAKYNAFLNLMLMCAGIGSPGTLSEVFRGYKGDRHYDPYRLFLAK